MLESKSKSLEEFNSWKTRIPSSTSTATFISGGGNFNDKSLQSWLTINPVTPLIPRTTLADSPKKSLEAYAIQIVQMDSNVCLSKCKCVCFVTLAVFVYVCVCVCASMYVSRCPLGGCTVVCPFLCCI